MNIRYPIYEGVYRILTKEREAYTAIGRPGTTGQSWQTLLFGRQGRDPSGFAEKSSSPGGLAVFFPKALPFRKRLP